MAKLILFGDLVAMSSRPSALWFNIELYQRSVAHAGVVHVNSAETKYPLIGVVRKHGEEVQASVSSSSSDYASELRRLSQNSIHVASKWDVNLISTI
ncbi:hypothetical protein AVEN_230666-1 [Araneus ventricosus]|uniref:Uncharacterized protein n=1 Tax=Araneus ventricosus TaxID=182803 RepID=A0A4Y2A297_ARAVE|nr:hypothetical protein AVEN_230666-1 [Araneus ventricosus]